MGGRSFFGPRIAGLIGAALALAVIFQQPGLVNVARDRLFDQYQRLAPRTYDQDPVKIVEIDDAALEKYGQWPWPRHRFADIVDKLNAADAAVIVFDVIFAEPDRTSPNLVSGSWVDSPVLSPIVSELSGSDLTAVDHDARLAASLAAAPTVMHLTARAGASTGTCPPALEASRVQGMRAQDLARVAPSFRQVVPPLPIFRSAASGEGFARAALSDDAIVRSVPLIALACDGTEIYPSLALEALRVGAPKLDPSFAPPEFVRAAENGACRAHVTGIAGQSVSEVVLCRLRFPTTEDGQLWVHYSKPDSVAKRRLSVVDVLENDAASLRDAVKGRVVMIGASAEGLRDVLITPLGDERPGVHIHAEVIEQALSGDTLFRAWDLMRPIEIGAAILVTVILLIILPRMSAAIGFTIWLIMTLAVFAGTYLAFSASRMLIDPVSPGLVVTSAFMGAFVVMFQQEQIARKFIRGAFGKFLSPLILDRLERDPSLLKLEGESREITAFFSDIRGFTSISEQMSPPDVTTLLNQYFTPMTRIVTEHKGLVDKYMGDGLAAMWNAPIDVDNHPEQAARASLQMLQSLEKLNQMWRSKKQLPVPEIKIGIGLHTAEARVGNFGSEDHLEYSMLGDMVNLTSRLESLTKQYGVPIIMSDETRDRIPDFAAVPLGAFTVKGRTDATVIFALVGDETVAARSDFQSFRRSFEAGVVALEEGEAFAALDHFNACRQGNTFGLDAALDIFCERAEAKRHSA
ncbi:adenylate/guanylate cyclase domain-containing protein [Hyphococcus flavus]|uniref:Adenylate/guanylate cyclase domain-containing protein n=1 Tax=Hyphococcus flavus TaxID=1866326 RepID=A0AAE9ZI37_9PROT|nr:adenylate/guanylate cyclase domain-containing protein [Hyphococcus flavus]WDI31296.1 adenylate/guanylate cyclase domain-containing protein [Hyphococcus flavus]